MYFRSTKISPDFSERWCLGHLWRSGQHFSNPGSSQIAKPFPSANLWKTSSHLRSRNPMIMVLVQNSNMFFGISNDFSNLTIQCLGETGMWAFTEQFLFFTEKLGWESDLAAILLLLHLLPPTSKGPKTAKIRTSQAADHLVRFMKVCMFCDLCAFLLSLGQYLLTIHSSCLPLTVSHYGLQRCSQIQLHPM